MTDLLTRLAERALGRGAPAFRPRVPSRYADATAETAAAGFTEEADEVEPAAEFAPAPPRAGRRASGEGFETSDGPGASYGVRARAGEGQEPPPMLEPSPRAHGATRRAPAESPAATLGTDDRAAPAPARATPPASAAAADRASPRPMPTPNVAPAALAPADDGRAARPPRPAAEAALAAHRPVPAALTNLTPVRPAPAGQPRAAPAPLAPRERPANAAAPAAPDDGRDAGPVVRVTIGRIEVRAAPALQPTPGARPGWTPPVRSLDAYLEREARR